MALVAGVGGTSFLLLWIVAFGSALLGLGDETDLPVFQYLFGIAAFSLVIDLARDIYPPLLADRGLEAAIEAQARKAAVPTTVAVEDIGRYPQEVESAVYFSVIEAMNNVAKYAEADATAVTIAQRNGSVEFAVRDDGRGFDDAATGYGTGLQGIVDRLDAIGGSVTIDSAPRRRHHRSRIGADRGR